MATIGSEQAGSHWNAVQPRGQWEALGPDEELPPEIHSEQSKVRNRVWPAPHGVQSDGCALCSNTHFCQDIPDAGCVAAGGEGSRWWGCGGRGLTWHQIYFFIVGMFLMCTFHLYTNY